MTWASRKAAAWIRLASPRSSESRAQKRRGRMASQIRLRVELLEDRRLLAVGPYAPAAGQLGSTAIAMDDPGFVQWASGWENYVAGDGVTAAWQTPQKTLGRAAGEVGDIASLGRGGEITLTFDRPIRNGTGADFAVFENGVADTFLELGYVEVSSDGANFFRFPNDSLTADPVAAFGSVEPTEITGYAGKYRLGYGTPFDLEELKAASLLLDVNHVSHIKVVDIAGDGTFLDSDGDVIYDPYPTVDSAGLDLDAVGVIHAAQYELSTVGFEDVGTGLPSESHWNGPDPDGDTQLGSFDDLVVVGSFHSGGLDLNNTFSLDYGNWAGWAYSNTTDATTPGHPNQYSAYAGAGAVGSPTYAVAFADGVGTTPTIKLTTETAGMTFRSLQVTNTTYTALSMRDGDSFAKPFGGATGDDPDWFLLTVTGRDADGDAVGIVEFYLADYRFSDNSQDYIVDQWATVDVSALRSATSLEFGLASSDASLWGMNTPAYFAVDDVVLARERLPLDISLSSVSEGAGPAAATATVSRGGANLSNPLTVTLRSSDTSEATIPASVTIPANQSFVQFDIAAVDDDLVDGTQTVTLTASATGWADGTGTLEVSDDDVLTLSMAIAPSSISEAAGSWAAVGTVTRNASDLSTPLTVDLVSDDASEASVATSVTILAGQASAQFVIDAVNDSVVDGPQVVAITATAMDYVAGSETCIVTDDDVLRLTLVITESAVLESDGAGAATGTVSRNDGDLSSPLAVMLRSNDTSEASVPSMATIPAGQASVSFPIAAVDDTLVDGPQTVEIRATALNYIFGHDTISVSDDDTLTLDLTLAAEDIAEGAGSAATTGTVHRNDGNLSQPLVVTLHSDDGSEVAIPTSVTIPAWQTSATFVVEAVDDAIVDQVQRVTISAAATGYVSGSDTVNVTDDDVLTLTLATVEPAVGEGVGTTTGTVSRNDGDLTSSLVITLHSDDTTVATAPTTVTIPANQSSVSFAISVADDALVDGLQTATLAAAADGYVSGTQTLNVIDDDVRTLTVVIAESTISENGGAAMGTVFRNDADLSSPLTVTLHSDDASEATAPGDVTIPADQTSVSFMISAGDDAIVDGSQNAIISAAAPSYVPGSATLTVTDDDVLSLTLSLADDRVSEGLGSGATTGVLSRNDGDLSEPLAVSLHSDDTRAATVPVSATIPAGESSVSFAIDAVDDSIVDGLQMATITATATAYVSASRILEVTDDDAPALRIGIEPANIWEGDAPPTARLEDLGATLADESFWNGSDGSGGFQSEGVAFNNDFNAAWGTWSGWSYTNATDTTSPGYGNQYSAFPGGGALGSATYATAYAAPRGFVPTIELTAATSGRSFESVTVANTTYAALAMLHGDAFAKPFGGDDGNDPDWFMLTIHGLDADGNAVGVVDFYLADYRSADPAGDYILETWADVDVSGLAGATRLAFSLSSSDVGEFGMNTPAYFAIDNIVLSGTAAATGTVHRNDGDLSNPLTVMLATDDATEATVPTRVTIPAGQTSASFAVFVVNDAVVDGSQTVTIAGEAVGYASAGQTVNVTDDDVLALTFSVSTSSVTEADGADVASGMVHRNDADLSSSLIVSLHSDDASEATVPASVTILAGESSAHFAIAAEDDAIVDGTQAVTITGSAAGYLGDVATLAVADDDVLTLTLSMAVQTVSEGSGAAATTATVYRNDGDLSAALRVTLNSDNTHAVTVPESVTIPAGQASVQFTIVAVDDAIVDGTQTAMISATAIGYLGDSNTLAVTDDDVPTLTITLAAESVSEADAPPTARMEDVGATLADEAYWNGADGSGGFQSDGVVFDNDYNAAWGTWSGWSYTNATDTTTAGYANQYSALAGGGALGSATYAVAYASQGGFVPTIELAAARSGATFQSLMVTNTTYAGLSMLDGDAFAKQFGGADGSESDWFLLTIDGLDDDGNSVGTVDFYLADYRSADPAGDYILDTWAQVDVSGLVDATRLAFSLSSSDVGEFGMNTPAYFAVDNVVLSGTAAATGTVHRNDSDLTNPLTVMLAVDDPTEATVPATVTIPAGAASASFAIQALDDAVVDGSRIATITGDANGYVGDSAVLQVLDDDILTLTLSLASSTISEASGLVATVGTVRRNDGDLSSPLIVTLASNDASEATAPATVTIPANHASAQFPVNAVDDALLDGSRDVLLTASLDGYASGAATLTVTDLEILVVEILADEISEKGGVTTATVTRTDIRGDLVVQLQVDDDTEATVAPSVVIPDGQATSASFALTALDDEVPDGIQTVQLTAWAAGYEDGTDTVDVAPYTTWQSSTHPCDVDADGWVMPVDILLVLNDLNRNGARRLPSGDAAGTASPPYVDVSGNGIVSAEDVLLVTTFINTYGTTQVGSGQPADAASGAGGPEGEGEPDESVKRLPRPAIAEMPRLSDNTEHVEVGLLTTPEHGADEIQLLLTAVRPTSELDEILDLISADVERVWQRELRHV